MNGKFQKSDLGYGSCCIKGMNVDFFKNLKAIMRLALLLGLLPVLVASPALAADISIDVIERGAVTIKLTPEQLTDPDSVYIPDSAYAPAQDGTVSCYADISIPVVLSADPARDKINAILHDYAQQRTCGYGTQSTYVVPRRMTSAGQVFSALLMTTYYGVGANGSCHSHWEGFLFNLASGHRYNLGEMIDPRKKRELQALILGHFSGLKDEHLNAPFDGALAALKEAMENDWEGMSLYLAGGRVRIHTSSYLFSCVEGNDFSFEVPRDYLAVSELTQPVLEILSP